MQYQKGSAEVSLFHAKIEGVPQFVSYFSPVHRAMQHLGGQATPKQVYAYLAEHEVAFPQTCRHFSKRSLTLTLELMRAELIEMLVASNSIVESLDVIEDF